MADDKNAADGRKKRRYEVVAEVLADANSYTKVDDLAKLAGMTKFKFAHSVNMAKRKLAEQGIMIVNELGEGYKVGTFEEFKDEVDKACKRSLSMMSSMARLINLLKNSGKTDANFGELESLVRNNLRKIDVLFEKPDINYEDYESYDEYSEALADARRVERRMIPDFVNTIPREIVGEDDPPDIPSDFQ